MIVAKPVTEPVTLYDLLRLHGVLPVDLPLDAAHGSSLNTEQNDNQLKNHNNNNNNKEDIKTKDNNNVK